MSLKFPRRSNSCSYIVKNTSLNIIKKKAEFLNQNWDSIRKDSIKKGFILPELVYPFLYQNEYAPLIATICDERVRAEDAWAFPEWLNSKLGGINPEEIIKLGKRGMRELLEEYFKDKWPSGMKEKNKEGYLRKTSESIVEAVKLFVKNNVTPITIFEDRTYTAAEVYFMLRQISGIGPKKATMITRDFLYTSKGIIGKHPWFDQVKAKRPRFSIEGIITPPIDVHVVKVFCRLFGVNLRGWESIKRDPDLIQDIITFSILAFPDQPAKIDELFWNIGRWYCRNESPNCLECPLNKICDYAGRRS